jgi:hypothetical protein
MYAVAVSLMRVRRIMLEREKDTLWAREEVMRGERL